MPSAHPQDSWELHESSNQSVNSRHRGTPCPSPHPALAQSASAPITFLSISYITPDCRGTNRPCSKASEHSCGMWLVPQLLLREDEDLIIDPVHSPTEQGQEGEPGENEKDPAFQVSATKASQANKGKEIALWFLFKETW